MTGFDKFSPTKASLLADSYNQTKLEAFMPIIYYSSVVRLVLS